MATNYYPAKSYLARNLAPEEVYRLGHADLAKFTTPPVGAQDIVGATHYAGMVAHGADAVHSHVTPHGHSYVSPHQRRAAKRQAWLERLAREGRTVHDWESYRRAR